MSLFDRSRPHDCRHALFGGAGDVRVWDLAPRLQAPFSAVLACELDPGGRVGEHVQQRDPEIVIGVEGRGVATVDGAPHPLVPGVTVGLPFGARLGIRNEDERTPLRYLIVKAEVPTTASA